MSLMEEVGAPADGGAWPLGEAPPLGQVPAKMHAWVIRRERYGEPRQAFAREVVDTPRPGPGEVLVYVMAAGINYNNVWASRGHPLDVIGNRMRGGAVEDFHIGGTDCSGIVWALGEGVDTLAVGDEVVLHGGVWKDSCPVVRGGGDPVSSPTFRAWGYETNFGSFGQFAKAQAHQCMPRPRHLTWEESAAYMASASTAYRMLHGWPPHTVRPGDVVLVWGGAGGLGSAAVQLAALAGARPVAVVSSADKAEYCMRLGAVGCIDRREFTHWGPLPPCDGEGYQEWVIRGARAVSRALWKAVGERVNPRIVVEHPGQDTFPTSVYVCDNGGMVVTCAGTTGYNAGFDLRYLWINQKRLQGSHVTDDAQANATNDLVREGRLDPCLGRAYAWEELAHTHQLMYENRHPHGNMAVLVGAPEFGLGAAVPHPLLGGSR